MTLADRLYAVLDRVMGFDLAAEFARGGGGGGAKSAKAAKRKYQKKAGGGKGKVDQKNCGRVAGRFAPGHTCGGAPKAVREEGAKAGERGLAAMLAKSRAAAAAKRAQADAPKAAAKSEPSLREQVLARKAARDQAAASPMRKAAIGEMVARSKGAAAAKAAKAKVAKEKPTPRPPNAALRAQASDAKQAKGSDKSRAVEVAAKARASVYDARAKRAGAAAKWDKVHSSLKSTPAQRAAADAKVKAADRRLMIVTRRANRVAKAEAATPDTPSIGIARDQKTKDWLKRKVAEARAAGDRGGASRLKTELGIVNRRSYEEAKAAPASRAAALKRMTDRSRAASGKAGAENAQRKQAAAASRSTKELERDLTSKDPAVRRAAMDGILAKQRAKDAADKERFGRKEVAKDLRKTGKAVEKARAKLDDVQTEARVMGKAGAAKAVLGKLESMKAEAGARGADAAAKAKEAAARAAVLREKLAASKSAGRPVTPVRPPRPSVEARPISDPVRLRAESSKMDEAFAKAPGGGRDNFVKITDLQKTMPHLSRDEFVAVLNAKRDAGELTMNSYEGRHGSLSPAENAAAIYEGGSRLFWVSRRDR